jgi:hypothetical protein
VTWTLTPDPDAPSGVVYGVGRTQDDQLAYTGSLGTVDQGPQYWLETMDFDGVIGWSALEGSAGEDVERGAAISTHGGTVLSTATLADWTGVIEHDLTGEEIGRWSASNLCLDDAGTLAVAGLACGEFYVAPFGTPSLVKVSAGCGG